MIRQPTLQYLLLSKGINQSFLKNHNEDVPCHFDYLPIHNGSLLTSVNTQHSLLFYLLFEGIDLLPILLLFLIVPGDTILKVMDVLGQLGFIRVEGLDLIGGNSCDVISEDNMKIAKLQVG